MKELEFEMNQTLDAINTLAVAINALNNAKKHDEITFVANKIVELVNKIK